MYRITRNDGYLMVKFIDDFDFPMIQTAIRHETTMREYADTNDIWLIGDNHARIRLAEVEMLVSEFQTRCSRYERRSKTALVVDAGLTGAIMELLVDGLKKRVAFEVEIFRTLEDAKEWLEVTDIRTHQDWNETGQASGHRNPRTASNGSKSCTPKAIASARSASN
jgi:hypothetical protein